MVSRAESSSWMGLDAKVIVAPIPSDLLLTTYYLRPTIILLGVAEFRAAMHVRSSFSVGAALDKLVKQTSARQSDAEL